MKRHIRSMTLAMVLAGSFTGQTVYAVDSCVAILVNPKAQLAKGAFVPASELDKAYPPESLFDAEVGGIAESRAFVRAGVAIEGRFTPRLYRVEDGREYYMPGQEAVELQGEKYVEFPNSTAFSVGTREFVLTRGVKPYKVSIAQSNGSIGPEGYISDVLLFERIQENGEAKYVFRHRLLESDASKKFFFEDPRISVVYSPKGQPIYFLSGTDYSPHVEGATDPDVMNRYVQLKIDKNGLPLPVKVDAVTSKPEFSDISPGPFQRPDGSYGFIDAKNGTIAQNEMGEIVIRSRLRPDFNDPVIKEMASGRSWKYAEQVFRFKDWSHFKSYDWNNAIKDLFGEESSGRVKPLEVKTIITDKDLKEHLVSLTDDLTLNTAKGKGLGPGTRPLRIRREGSKIFISDAKNAPESLAGEIPANLLGKSLIKDGEVTYLTFDHEIRYFDQKLGNGRTATRRHYSASLKFFDASLMNMIDYRADVIQPKTRHERGFVSGILDLLHVYPMGFVIDGKGQKDRALVRVYAGASDAHTTVYEFDIVKLLIESAPKQK